MGAKRMIKSKRISHLLIDIDLDGTLIEQPIKVLALVAAEGFSRDVIRSASRNGIVCHADPLRGRDIAASSCSTTNCSSCNGCSNKNGGKGSSSVFHRDFHNFFLLFRPFRSFGAHLKYHLQME